MPVSTSVTSKRTRLGTKDRTRGRCSGRHATGHGLDSFWTMSPVASSGSRRICSYRTVILFVDWWQMVAISFLDQWLWQMYYISNGQCSLWILVVVFRSHFLANEQELFQRSPPILIPMIIGRVDYVAPRLFWTSHNFSLDAPLLCVCARWSNPHSKHIPTAMLKGVGNCPMYSKRTGPVLQKSNGTVVCGDMFGTWVPDRHWRWSAEASTKLTEL